jgi:hypothetical protein
VEVVAVEERRLIWPVPVPTMFAIVMVVARSVGSVAVVADVIVTVSMLSKAPRVAVLRAVVLSVLLLSVAIGLTVTIVVIVTAIAMSAVPRSGEIPNRSMVR